MKPFPDHFEVNSFRRFEHWKDHQSGFLLWPSAWLRLNRERGLTVRYNELVCGFGRHRWRWTWGRHCNLDRAQIPTWNAIGGDEFLDWARKTMRVKWGKEEVQKFFSKNERWRDLVMMSGFEPHYVRVLIARELLQERSKDLTLNDLENL